MKRRAKSCRSVATCLIVLVLLAVLFVPSCFAVGACEASTAVGQAEHDLGSAHIAVAEAEDAGADVSALLNKLSNAGDFLSEAYAALRIENYANASVLAMECSNTVEGVAGDAARLKTNAESAITDRLLFAVAGSGVGLILLLIFGFLGWKLLKRRYFKQVLDMKPQVEAA
ncbi:hypothetical protein MUP38_05305 [Candidatus Bathyarchaeota archaeon]|nr:hypothetical protein [Candidatus Bathyarchaeota archaeon]